jgi:phosphatidylserine/phosphatidylglycerophosphate/cardiolipin synthase-like enzyme
MTRRKTTRSQNALIGLVITFFVLGGIYLMTGTNIVNPTGQPTPTVQTPGNAGSWWQVSFTQPGGEYNPADLSGTPLAELVKRIDSAQQSIHIAAFEFNLTPVAEALIAAHQRGVDVRWVTDDENGIDVDGDEGRGQFAMLEKAGIQVKDDGRGALMHNKFWIFDGQVVWTGSTNPTINDYYRNNNNILVVSSTDVARAYESEFSEMWAGKFGPTSPSTLADQSFVVEGTPVQVLFASEDEVMSYLVALVQNAHQSLRFMAFSFTHPDLGDAMLERARAGVDVRGIFEQRGSETEFSQLAPLYCARVPVRQDGNPGTFHHKVLVIDGQTVVTGSLNFSQNADESNDENTVVITNPAIAQLYLDEFERRWSEATEPADICN